MQKISSQNCLELISFRKLHNFVLDLNAVSIHDKKGIHVWLK